MSGVLRITIILCYVYDASLVIWLLRTYIWRTCLCVSGIFVAYKANVLFISALWLPRGTFDFICKNYNLLHSCKFVVRLDMDSSKMIMSSHCCAVICSVCIIVSNKYMYHSGKVGDIYIMIALTNYHSA